MDPQQYIRLYGGKAGAWFYLKELGGFERHILPLVYLDRDSDFSAIKSKFPTTFPKKIVRATHSNDYEGLVDILETHKNNQHIYDLEEAIEIIREKANSEVVVSYNAYEGQPYDGKIGIMIQPQNEGVRGSIAEHPHERGTYLIDLVERLIGSGETLISRVIVTKSGIDNKHAYVREAKNEELIREIIDLYKRIQQTNFVPQSFSFQMEYGINSGFSDKANVLFYQARPFKRFEKADYGISGSFMPYECFGITPKDGVILPVVKTFSGEGVNDINEPFALVVENMTIPMNPWVQPRNMKAFLPIGNRVNSLEHNTYRWIRKAEISITSPLMQFTLRKLSTGDKVKIQSDGINYELEKLVA